MMCTAHDSTAGCQAIGCAERGSCVIRRDGWHQWACPAHALEVGARFSPELAAKTAAALKDPARAMANRYGFAYIGLEAGR